jgi:hypothetical protein
VQKLKSGQAVRRSLKHTFREQETPNADASKTPDNLHIGGENVATALERFNARMPDKVRKNAVLCVEHLITASPEAMAGKGRAEQDAYFLDSLEWLRQRYGAANVVHATVHRDETTPHLVAYVVPLDGRGKLNCRAYLGERDALSRMQTEFARDVAAKHGLERGLEGSRARHTTIREYYGRVDANNALEAPTIDLPPSKLVEGKETYARRSIEAYKASLLPRWRQMDAQARELAVERQRREDLEKTAKWATEQAAPVREALRGLPVEAQRTLWQKFQGTAAALKAMAKQLPEQSQIKASTKAKLNTPEINDMER